MFSMFVEIGLEFEWTPGWFNKLARPNWDEGFNISFFGSKSVSSGHKSL